MPMVPAISESVSGRLAGYLQVVRYPGRVDHRGAPRVSPCGVRRLTVAPPRLGLPAR